MNTPTINTHKKVLVVDDEAGMRITLKGILERKGFKVVLADDGAKAVDVVKVSHFDIVLMDMKMPNMGGTDAYLQMKSIDPSLHVVLMTGYVKDADMKRAEDNGALILTKPLDINQVLDLLK